jgi:hypothetical protein
MLKALPSTGYTARAREPERSNSLGFCLTLTWRIDELQLSNPNHQVLLATGEPLRVLKATVPACNLLTSLRAL